MSAARSSEQATGRAMFAKTIAAVTDAVLLMDEIVPDGLAIGHFQPKASLLATVRFANASASPQSDSAPDTRGLSLRLLLPDGGAHDMLFANFPTFPARNSLQFFELAMMSIGDPDTMLVRLVNRIGIREGRRIAAYKKVSLKLCPSLASERYWTGCAFLWGDVPARLELRPTISRSSTGATPALGPDALRVELAERLSQREVSYRLAIQIYVDERRTPIEDAARNWPKSVAPSIEIATLILPQQEILGVAGLRARHAVGQIAFNVWNAPAAFRPLGSLNRMRRIAYEAGTPCPF